MRPWQTWTLFGVCLAVAFTIMGWLSVALIRLDRSEADARREALEEENIRLALWRMESALGPIIAQESRRPYFEFRPFYAPRRAYTAMYGNFTPGEILLPSPLMTDYSPYVLLHFQLDAENVFSSPHVPPDDRPDLELPAAVTAESISLARQRLQRLPGLFDYAGLLARLPAFHTHPETSQPATLQDRDGAARTHVQDPSQLPSPPVGPSQRQAPPAQSMVQRWFNDSQQDAQWQQRNAAEQNARIVQSCDNSGLPLTGADGSTDVHIGPMQPTWIEDDLFLLRRVTIGPQQLVQGCWIDRSAIAQLLLSQIADLCPGASLQPAPEARADKDTRLLAALPLRLIPGTPPPMSTADESSPIPLTLAIAWFGVAVAALAGFLLLRGTISLSERRAAFVSAVTHEMRTPLTTLRMYTEMLTKGMVPDESQRARYLQTLSTEASRLGYLVENVLAFARLENNHDSLRLETPTLRDLLDRIVPRLADRASQAGMTLQTPADGPTLDQRVRVQPAAVEHILFNLVDNACKYAHGVPAGAIQLDLAGADPGRGPGQVELAISDSGPGVRPEYLGRLFQPFSKSAHDAADTAPGIGLGLALSRRLARGMGGDLTLDPRQRAGARFILHLSRA